MTTLALIATSGTAAAAISSGSLDEARADAPSSSVPYPVGVAQTDEAPAASPSRQGTAAVLASPAVVAEIEAPGAFAAVYEPTSNRFVIAHAGRLLALSSEGEIIGRSSVVLPIGNFHWDGDLYFQYNNGLVEIDPVTLTVVATYDLPYVSFRFAAVGEELWLLPGGSVGPLIVIDRATGDSREVALPPEVDSAHLSSVLHSPGIGARLIVESQNFGPTSYVVDVSSEPIVVERQINEEVLAIANSGVLFTKLSNGPAVTSRPVDTLAADAVAVFDGNVSPFDFQYAEQADVIIGVTRVGFEFRTDDGAPVREPLERARWVFSDDARYAVAVSSNTVTVQALGPSYEPTGHAFFQPTWYDELRVNGDGLGAIATATVNGRTVPHRAIDRGLMLDVSALPRTTTTDGRIVLAAPLGGTSFTVPALPDRDRAALTIRATHLDDDPSPKQYSVCTGERHSLGDGEIAVLDVPAGSTCTVKSSSNSSTDGTRSGLFDPTRLGSFVDTNAASITVATGRPAHVWFKEDRPQPRDNILWLFTFGIGEAPTDVTYPFKISCGSWSTTVRIRSGFGVRVIIPDGRAGDNDTDVGTAFDCTARLQKKRGAERVNSFIASLGFAHEFSGRSIDFERAMDRQDRYLVFGMDYGGYDSSIPQVIAAPREDIGSKRNAGIVHVLAVDGLGIPTGKGSKRLRQGRGGLGNAAEAGDKFGEATVIGDFDGDGYYDIAISAPGEDLGTTKNAGIVHIVYGTATGYRSTRTQLFHQNVAGVPETAGRGDKFGAALAVVDYDGDGYDDLAVGIPGKRVNGHRKAGMVQVFHGGRGGLGLAHGFETITQDSPGMATAAEAGDGLGSALAGHGTLLAVGVPGEDLGSDKNAGGVHIIEGISRDSLWSTQTPKRGKRETGDRYGSALAMGPRWIGVGVPGEDFGEKRNVGAVQVLGLSDTSFKINGVVLVRPRKLVPNREVAGARFGASLQATGGGFEGAVFIGSPGAEVDGKARAGMVYVARKGGLQAGGAWSQEVLGFPSPPSAGDEFGAAISLNARGGLVVAAPGETVSGHSRAGAVFATSNGLEWTTLTQNTRGIATKAEGGDRLGLGLSG